MHVKLVDPEVRERVQREKLSLAEAVPLGIMVEPPYGEPKVPALLDALAGLDRDLFVVIEQDLYPIAPPSAAGHPGQSRRVLHRPRPRPDPPLAVLTAASLGVAHNPLSRKAFHVTVNVGVIGVGMIGQDHIRRLTQVLSGARVSGVTDVDLVRAQDVVGKIPGAKLYQSGQELINSPDVDAVVIASWGGTHEDYVLAGIAAGKQVFCEKPLATTKDACLRDSGGGGCRRTPPGSGGLHAPLRRGLSGA